MQNPTASWESEGFVSAMSDTKLGSLATSLLRTLLYLVFFVGLLSATIAREALTRVRSTMSLTAAEAAEAVALPPPYLSVSISIQGYRYREI